MYICIYIYIYFYIYERYKIKTTFCLIKFSLSKCSNIYITITERKCILCFDLAYNSPI